MSEYLNILTLSTGHKRKSGRVEVSEDLIEQVKPLFGEAIESWGPVDVLASGWWLKACESTNLTVELRDMHQAVPRAELCLEFELWPRVYDTQPIVCAVEPHCDSETAATLNFGVRGHGIERQIRCRIPTEADLERCIAWVWLDSLKDTNGVWGNTCDPLAVPVADVDDG